MKKILAGFLLVFYAFSLFGCLSTTPTTVTTTEGVTMETREVSFVNYSTEFLSEGTHDGITFYYFSAKDEIPYVDITEFVALLEGIIDDSATVEVLPDDQVKAYVEYYPTEEEKAQYGIEEDVIVEYALFDFVNTTVSAPSINSFDYFSGDTETDFGAGLIFVSAYDEELPAFTADLGEYGFTFEKTELEGGAIKYLVPLSIADLFLTGSMFDVVNNGAYLYGVDTYQLGELPAQVTALNNDATPAVKTETMNYLALVFDYFYGLKAYKDIESFQEILPSYFNKFFSTEFSINDFADSLEDLHTAVITTGHNNPTYDHYAQGYEMYPDYLQEYFENSYGCNCDGIDEGVVFDLKQSTGIAYLQINEFTEEFVTDVAPYMEDIRDAAPDYVVLDLSCNGGGVLAGVFHLLNYLTNDDISLYTTTLGAKSSITYDVEGDKAIDAQFFIVTSAATFSAANLFTSMAKEQGLAKTIGQKSGGGACSVKAIVLPNGAIMQMSSNMNLTYSTWETVEEGVDVDYAINFSAGGRVRIQHILAGQSDPVNEDFPTLAEFYHIAQELDDTIVG
jgi:hypothetical protein